MKVIESTKNNWVKQVKKLEKKKYRDQEGLYLIEGEHLVEEAIKHNVEFEFIIVTEKSRDQYATLIEKVDQTKHIQVTVSIIKYLSNLPSPQPILAVVKKQNDSHIKTSTNHVLLLDNVQDPGNVGTMIRTADAAGFLSVILGTGTADVYNNKVMRSMQGSQFHINIEENNLITKIDELKNEGYVIYATELNEEAIPYNEIKKNKKIAFILGNEGQGVNPILLDKADERVYIPMLGKAESLNVAIAGGILMFSI